MSKINIALEQESVVPTLSFSKKRGYHWASEHTPFIVSLKREREELWYLRTVEEGLPASSPRFWTDGTSWHLCLEGRKWEWFDLRGS